MPKSIQSELINILEIFMDELVEKYTVFRELNITSTSSSLYGGYNTSEDEAPNLSFRLDGYFFNKSELKNYIRAFVETGDFNYSNTDRNEVRIFIMKFLDDFMENHLLIEGKRERLASNLPTQGYRYSKEEKRSELNYNFRGTIPTREEMEAKVRVFIEMNKL